MNKDLILNLLRQVLTYGGTALTSAGVASSEEIATGAGALVTLLGVAWTIVARQRAKSAAAVQAASQADPEHHTIGMPPATERDSAEMASPEAMARRADRGGRPLGGQGSNLILLAFVLPALLTGLLSGCRTVIATDGAGNVTSETQADWDTINHATRLAAKYAIKTVLDRSPDYAENVTAVTDSMSALFSGLPTEESLAGTLAIIAPDLDDGDAALLVSVILDAWELYTTKTGNPVLIPLDENVRALVEALTTGIADGIALHHATLRP
ncbi:hypothetical protein OPIT5_29360 [Opitutaceae bacterium TAV5]|nr:hypothetical protein OPIT5_21760 [Opitutaceae bacterium TAV5]AHF93687.1 hypothetical protein OPIT5_29360 [Opitutaceae bacterium TAV5]